LGIAFLPNEKKGLVISSQVPKQPVESQAYPHPSFYSYSHLTAGVDLNRLASAKLSH
jgi:hypothetical protein